jgi:hypothetical protein
MLHQMAFWVENYQKLLALLREVYMEQLVKVPGLIDPDESPW